MSYQHMQWAIAQDVPPTQGHVLLVLALHMGNNEHAFPSIATLSQETGLSRTAVKVALRALAGANLIVIEPKPNDANRYILQMTETDAETTPTVAPAPATEGHQATANDTARGAADAPRKERETERENKSGGGRSFRAPDSAPEDPHGPPRFTPARLRTLAPLAGMDRLSPGTPAVMQHGHTDQAA